MEFCSLASSSSGNSQYIASKDTKILLDAGLSGKYIKNSLVNIDVNIDDIDAMLITHEHMDHIKGVGVLMRRHNIPIYLTEGTWLGLSDKIGKVDMSKVHIIKNNEIFDIKDLQIRTHKVTHDANDPVAYSLTDGKNSIGIMTDLGDYNQELLKELRKCDLVMLEANHDEEMLKTGSYPYSLKRRILSEFGHLSNDISGEIAMDIVKYGSTKHILLGHLSRENNFPELAFETVKCILENAGLKLGHDVMLNMTYRDKISQYYRLGY